MHNSKNTAGPIRLACATRRSRAIACAAGLLSLAACASPGDFLTVTADRETAAVFNRGDAADDSVVIPGDDGRFWILGTDKQYGLRVYDSAGAQVLSLETGRLNNVDAVRRSDGSYVVTASNRTTTAIDVYVARPTGTTLQVSQASSIPLDLVEPYGLCMARLDGEITVFVGDKSGTVEQWRLNAELAGTRRNVFEFASQTEGCVVDVPNRRLFVGEEETGIWVTDLETREARLFAAVDGKLLRADVEGLDIYSNAADRWLVASSQGNSSYAVYDLADGAARLSFRVVRNKDSSIDGVSNTDGVAVYSAPLGDFPAGVLVVQDGRNTHPRANQNFKIIDWRKIDDLLDGH